MAYIANGFKVGIGAALGFAASIFNVNTGNPWVDADAWIDSEGWND